MQENKPENINDNEYFTSKIHELFQKLSREEQTSVLTWILSLRRLIIIILLLLCGSAIIVNEVTCRVSTGCFHPYSLLAHIVSMICYVYTNNRIILPILHSVDHETLVSTSGRWHYYGIPLIIGACLFVVVTILHYS